MIPNEWQMRGKETSPEKTVEKIKNILHDNDFDYRYVETKSGISDCCSSILSLVPPDDSLMVTNGKGMSRALCSASAFAEMMERMSNCIVLNLHPHDPKSYEIFKNHKHFYSVYGENQTDCMKKLKKSILDSMKDPGFCSKEMLLDVTLGNVCGNDGRVPSYPFYSVKDKKIEYLPFQLLCQFTESTGMAAGNSIPEAIVEGASEILERYVQAKVLEGGIRLTRLPEEVLSKYPHIVSMIREIEKDGDKTVILMDASLGKDLPVMCGVCINHNTGRIGVKFGAHPNMAVAIERIFTEGTQGRDVEIFSKLNSVIFKRDYEGKRIENWANLKCGVGRVPADILVPDPPEMYKPWADTENESNEKLMWRMIGLMQGLGADVYIRDSSVFGFPAVYIYAAGISETYQADWITLSFRNAVIRSQYTLTHLDKAEEKDIKELALIAGVKENAFTNKDYSYLMSVPMKYKMPGGIYQGLFLRGMCKYYLGEIEEAKCIVENVVSQLGNTEDFPLERAIGTYLSGLSNGFELSDIEKVIKTLYPDYCDKIMDIMSDPKTVLIKIYPVCKGFNCEQCGERSICRYPELLAVNERIWDKYNAYEPSEEDICELFI